ncbi:MAG: cell envelope integrity protein CreD [Bacteroidales bacterium]|nr:cell envelope integrity protein CreD [Bacteroidales bacterium]
MNTNKPSFSEKYSAIIKIISIAFIILLLLIPTGLIRSLVREREATQQEAIWEVSSKWGNSQTITGPIITIPYISYIRGEKNEIIKIKSYAHFLPEELNINGKISPELRYRGIYEVIVYESELHFNGKFNYPDLLEMNIPIENVLFDEAYISIGIPDMRGIEENINVTLNDSVYSVNPGVESNDIIVSGVSTKIKINKKAEIKEINFNFDIYLNGSDALFFTPVGKETNVNLSSTWNNPGFNGAFLPDERNVDDNGFSAKWKVLHLNRNYPQQWTENNYNISESTFGVNLLLPVDAYQKSMRSAKYAVMFISLTFLIFFFIEVLNKKRIHPIQYILVGLALCVFYTLLLSLSEHIGFKFAYLIAAISTVTLITLYSKSIFKEKNLTILMGGILTVLYFYIYILLQLQDYALLLGSIGLFVVLAIVMYLSRKVDWYSTGIKNGQKNNI